MRIQFWNEYCQKNGKNGIIGEIEIDGMPKAIIPVWNVAFGYIMFEEDTITVNVTISPLWAIKGNLWDGLVTEKDIDIINEDGVIKVEFKKSVVLEKRRF